MSLSNFSFSRDAETRSVETRVGHFLNRCWPEANLIWVSDGSRVYEVRRDGQRAVLKVFLPMEINRSRLEPFQDTVDRYERELAAATAFSTTPHGLPVLDARITMQIPYMIFPFVDGTTLENEIDQRNLNRLRGVRILRTLAEATRDLHDLGYLHCDLKPSNVLLESDKLFLIDFGCVKRISKLGSKDDPVYFSVGYTAPECLSRDQPETTAIDVFSLGMIAHELFGEGNPFNIWYENYLGSETDTFSLYVKFLTVDAMPLMTSIDRVPNQLARAIDFCTSFNPITRLRTPDDLVELIAPIEKNLVLSQTGRLKVLTAA